MFSDFLILLLLILANGVLAGAEIAFLNVSASRHRHNIVGIRKNIYFDRLMNDEAKFLATIQIGITFFGLFSGAFAATVYAEPLSALLYNVLPIFEISVMKQIVTLLLTAVLSYFSIVVGELVPKKLAIRYSRSLTSALVIPIYFLSIIVRPAVSLLTVSTNIVFGFLRIDPHERESIETAEEIKKLLEVSDNKGSIDETEKEMIHNIFEFDSISADEISTHRRDIIALDVGAPKAEIIEVVTNERFSRIPVYEENIDNIIGILHVRDFLNYIIIPDNFKSDTVDLRSLIRKPYFVPISKKTDELFEEMQKSKIHLAIVVDEYGGTTGIVTMEDLIEKIMGSILDEYDAEEKPEIEHLDDSSYIINGSADLDLVSEKLGITLPCNDYDTLSGFLIGQLGHIPHEDERPELEFEGVVFKLTNIEDKKISRVIATKVS